MQSKIVLRDFGLEAIEWATSELSNIVALISTVVVVILIHHFAFSPINRIKDLTDIGYEQFRSDASKRGRKFKDHINELRRLKQRGEMPPVIPNGWYGIIESKELKPGDVKSVNSLGKTFAVFRSLDGKSYVLDAHCPHLGANLGVGGRLFGSCIECPFHGWQFDGKTGECVQVPYSSKVPAHSKIRKWQSLEQTGWIFIWYHAEEEEPSWFPPDITEVSSGEWVLKGRTEHFISSHIQEISENGSDMSHLPQVHSPSMFAGVDLRYTRDRLWNFAKHVWNISWKEQEAPNAHMAEVTLSHTMRLFGKLPILTTNVIGHQIGPALVYLRMTLAIGNGIFIQTATPTGPLETRMVHQFYAPRYVPTPYCNIIVIGEAIMFERDVMVWNHKRFVLNPVLVKEDRLIARHRRWFSQFYSENSPHYSTVVENLNW